MRTPAGERLFSWLIRAYPRDFRRRYEADLIAFFRQDRDHPRYGRWPLRPFRFWASTVRDLARVAAAERMNPAQPSVRHIEGATAMPSLSTIMFDVRYAVRSLRATPAVTMTALLVLTLGIGASTAIYSVVDGVVLRGLPFGDPTRLVSVNETDLATGRPGAAAFQNYVAWRDQQDVFDGLAASAAAGALMTTDPERPERLQVHKITANLFDVLWVRPAMGRGFTAADERGTEPRVALLSDALWRRRFHADPNVIGRAIPLETGTVYVAGVMAKDFVYPIGSTLVSNVDLWIPFVPEPKDLVRTPARNYFTRVIGRLKPGVSIEQASARMTQIRDALAIEHPRWFHDQGILVRPLKDATVPATVRSWMLMLLAAVGGVLLAACANVANLLLARASGRGREIGVRAAMGATRAQLVRGMIVESVLLALAGTAGGLVVAYWGVDFLRATLPANLPRVWAIAVDLRVVGVAGLAALVTGVLCGLLPALQMSRPDVAAALRGSTRSATASAARQRARTAFLVAEVALAAVLLVGAGMFVSSFVRLVNTDLGFDSERLMSVTVNQKWPTEDAERQRARADSQLLMQQALERVRAVPGVESAALLAGGVPLSGSWASQPVHVAGRTFTKSDEVVLKQMTAGYLETVGATLLMGRTIQPSDGKGSAPVVVLNDEAARRYLGDRNPLGAQVAIDEEAPRTVVGVIRGMRLLGPETDVRPEAYVPYEQGGLHSISASLVIRTTQAPMPMATAVKNAIWSVMPNVVIPEPRTFDEMFAGLIAQRKLNMILLALFGTLALLIAAIGIYGVIAYLVEQRTKEIGVRMALGALPSRILGMILSRAALAIGAGLGVGFLCALWLERIVMAFVFRGIPHDPIVYGGVTAILLTLGLFAAFVPARRAARVDPMVALRID